MMRASDAERDQVLDRLRRAHEEGRLNLEEFTERAGRALRARTAGALETLTEDLPRQAVLPTAGRTRAPIAISPVRPGLLLLVGGCLLILVTSGHRGGSPAAGLWPFWLVFWWFLLSRHHHRRRHVPLETRKTADQAR